jgi:hypothetical protein
MDKAYSTNGRESERIEVIGKLVNSKVAHGEIGWGAVDWIGLNLVGTSGKFCVLNVRMPYRAGKVTLAACREELSSMELEHAASVGSSSRICVGDIFSKY